jgi:hypothetical protein
MSSFATGVSGWVLLVVDYFLLRCSWCPPCGFNGYSSAAATWASCGGGPWVRACCLRSMRPRLRRFPKAPCPSSGACWPMSCPTPSCAPRRSGPARAGADPQGSRLGSGGMEPVSSRGSAAVGLLCRARHARLGARGYLDQGRGQAARSPAGPGLRSCTIRLVTAAASNDQRPSRPHPMSRHTAALGAEHGKHPGLAPAARPCCARAGHKITDRYGTCGLRGSAGSGCLGSGP